MTATQVMNLVGGSAALTWGGCLLLLRLMRDRLSLRDQLWFEIPPLVLLLAMAGAAWWAGSVPVFAVAVVAALAWAAEVALTVILAAHDHHPDGGQS